MTFIFPYIENNHPNWLIFFRGIETTNQLFCECHYLVWRKINARVVGHWNAEQWIYHMAHNELGKCWWILVDAHPVETNVAFCSKNVPLHVQCLKTTQAFCSNFYCMSLYVQLLKTKEFFVTRGKILLYKGYWTSGWWFRTCLFLHILGISPSQYWCFSDG